MENKKLKKLSQSCGTKSYYGQAKKSSDSLPNYEKAMASDRQEVREWLFSGILTVIYTVAVIFFVSLGFSKDTELTALVTAYAALGVFGGVVICIAAKVAEKTGQPKIKTVWPAIALFVLALVASLASTIF